MPRKAVCNMKLKETNQIIWLFIKDSHLQRLARQLLPDIVIIISKQDNKGT